MIAVIGATGFTGHRVVHALRKASPKEEIVAVVRPTSDRRRLEGAEAIYRVADLQDTAALTAALHGASRVVCVASLGFGHVESICGAVETEAREHAVFFSTTSIFTGVATSTRHMRVIAEERIHASNRPSTILRPTMIFGRPGDRNIERLLRWLVWVPVVPAVGAGRALQQPVHVDDLADAVVAVFATPTTRGSTYNLPGATAASFADLVRMAAAAVGRRPTLLPINRHLAGVTAWAWSRTGLWPRINGEQVARLLEDKAFNTDHATVDFGYAPRTFAAGVLEEACLLGLHNGKAVADADREIA